MRHIILTIALSVFATGLFAQEGLKFGIQGGLPFNDFNDEVGVVVGGGNRSYVWPWEKLWT